MILFSYPYYMPRLDAHISLQDFRMGIPQFGIYDKTISTGKNWRSKTENTGRTHAALI
jgi:hypothetical protein